MAHSWTPAKGLPVYETVPEAVPVGPLVVVVGAVVVGPLVVVVDRVVVVVVRVVVVRVVVVVVTYSECQQN